MLVLLFYSINVFSNALILVPVEANLNSNDSIELGSLMPGQELKLIVSDNSFENNLLWEKAEVILPKNWKLIYSKKEDKSLELLIKLFCLLREIAVSIPFFRSSALVGHNIQ